MAMTALAQEFFQKFGELLGFGRGRIGLVLTVPTFLAAFAQQVSPWAVRRLGSYRRWVVLTAGFQAAALVPLAGLAWWAAAGGAKESLGETGLTLGLFVLAGAYWFGALAGNAPWMTLVGMLIPKRIESRYFTRRQALLNLTLLITLAIATEWLGRAGETPGQLRAMGWMLLIAGLCRAVSTWCLWKYSDPGIPEVPVLVWPRELAHRARRHAGGRALLLLLCAQAAISIAHPYFASYMLEQAGVPTREFGWLLMLSFVGKMAAPEVLRVLIDQRGLRHALGLTLAWQVIVPVIWLIGVILEPSRGSLVELTWLGISQFCVGLGLGGFEMCSTLIQLDHVPVRERNSVLSQFNFALYSAGLMGSLVGLAILSELSGGMAFVIVFVTSAVARVGAMRFMKHGSRHESVYSR